MKPELRNELPDDDKGIKAAYEILRNLRTYPRHLQLHIAEMRGGRKAQEPEVYECPKGTVQYGIHDKKIINDEGEEQTIPITTLLTGTKKPVRVSVIGQFENLVYSTNKAEMELYQRYISLGVAIIVIGLCIIDFHLHMTPLEELSMDFWNNAWIMVGITAVVLSMLFLKAFKDDTSLDIFQGTVERSSKPAFKIPAYVCTSSQMPDDKTFELYGRSTCEGVVERQLGVLEHLQSILADELSLVYEENRHYRQKITMLTQKLKKTRESGGGFTTAAEADLMKTKIVSRHFLYALSIGAAAFISFVALLIYHFSQGG